MKYFLMFVILLSVGSICSAEDIRMLSGQTYSNVSIMRVERDAIVCMRSSGIYRIPLAEVSKDLQIKYKYNATNAAAYAASKKRSAQLYRAAEAERLKIKEQKDDAYAVEVEAKRKADRNEKRLKEGASIFELER